VNACGRSVVQRYVALGAWYGTRTQCNCLISPCLQAALGRLLGGASDLFVLTCPRGVSAHSHGVEHLPAEQGHAR
jgi:hypothetical protein